MGVVALRSVRPEVTVVKSAPGGGDGADGGGGEGGGGGFGDGGGGDGGGGGEGGEGGGLTCPGGEGRGAAGGAPVVPIQSDFLHLFPTIWQRLTAPGYLGSV